MTELLDIHPASDDERVELFRNVFDIWPMRATVEEHIEARLNSVQHRRANWWVGCVGGRVAVSLGCFPLEFRIHGEVVPGFSIGAVHCHQDFRRRGFAPALMAEVERQSAAHVAAMAVLYTDIKPEYYARMGYLECPSWELDLDNSSLPASEDSTSRTRVCESAADAETVRALYERFHESLPLAIHRGDDYWSYLKCKTPRDQTFLLPDAGGEPAGCLRVGISKGEMIVRDCAPASDSDSAIRQLFASAVEIARSHQVQRLIGWVPGEQSAMRFLKPVRRKIEITMVKSLREDITIDNADRQAADWFHEIDHV